MVMIFRKRHNQGYLFGFVFSSLVLLFLFLPSSQTHLRNGPMLPGQEELKCFSCHIDEVGSFRQQLQANIQYLLNNREHVVSVGLRTVENSECLKCHIRPNERHPVYRFREPKYRKVRENIKADSCIACHQEHNSKRINVQPDFCMHCHDELKLKKDPLDISHQKLIQLKKWESCLTCHDFHCNHSMKLEDRIEKGISIPKLKKYFDRGNNPYPGKIIHKAKYDDEKQ